MASKEIISHNPDLYGLQSQEKEAKVLSGFYGAATMVCLVANAVAAGETSGEYSGVWQPYLLIAAINFLLLRQFKAHAEEAIALGMQIEGIEKTNVTS